MRVAINGFGRIGRCVFRILARRRDIEVVAINDVAPDGPLAYLLKHDSVMGEFEGDVALADGRLIAGTQRPRLVKGRNPKELPWREHGVDVVIESTGRFRSRAELSDHLSAGAGKVLLTVPAKDAIDAMIVIGANEECLRPEHRIVSNASCTTNCLAPLARVLHESFGIVKGVMTTVHAYTNDQRLADWAHSDLRRSRAAGENIIPTTTGAARSVGEVLPQLKGRLDGVAMRVPVPDGSIVDLVAQLERRATSEDVNEAVRAAAQGAWRGIIEYSTVAVVSSDIIGNSHSAVFDAPLTRSLAANMIKVFAWYDNEWAYSQRVVDLVVRMGPGGGGR